MSLVLVSLCKVGLKDSYQINPNYLTAPLITPNDPNSPNCPTLIIYMLDYEVPPGREVPDRGGDRVLGHRGGGGHLLQCHKPVLVIF